MNADTAIIDHWTFGGGTAMMLQIDHRESRDVDFFLPDPQLLSFLAPETHDFAFEIEPSGNHGDGASFLKLAFENVGEIDFIVSQPKTPNPTILRDIEGEQVLLETVPEIVAKKVVHRAASLRPRDIFDIAAAAREHEDGVVVALRPYGRDVATALETLARLNPDFVNEAISQLQIREGYRSVATSAIERARQILQAV